MPEFLKAPFANAVAVDSWNVAVRLLVALAMGAAVAWIYVRTTRDSDMGRSFPTTLVLLAVLIAMVTQIIGDSVARAFSLVGALSIVRFRTVVRDTRDTAFVIFAVVIGMAVGAHGYWVAALGIAIVGLTAFVMSRKSGGQADPAVPGGVLRLRMGLGLDIDPLAGAVLDAHLSARELVSVSTAKQGLSVNYIFDASLKPGCPASELVRALNRIEGVQDVQYCRRGFEAE
jgi:hypothetical protein